MSHIRDNLSQTRAPSKINLLLRDNFQNNTICALQQSQNKKTDPDRTINLKTPTIKPNRKIHFMENHTNSTI